MIFSYWAFYFFSAFYFIIATPKVENQSGEIKKQPGRAEIAAMNARSNYNKGRFATALSLFSNSVGYAAVDKNDTCWFNAQIGVANSFRNLFLFEKSKKVLDQVEEDPRFNAYQNSLSYSSYIFSRSSLYRKLGDTLKSIHLIDSGIKHLQKWLNPLDTLLAAPYELKAYIYFCLKDLDSSLVYYKKALLARKINNNKNYPALKNNYIGINKIYELKGDNKNLLENIALTLELFDEIPKKDTLTLISYYYIQIMNNRQLGRFEDALLGYSKYEDLVKDNPKYSYLYKDLLFSKSNLYFFIGDYERAESIYKNLIDNSVKFQIKEPASLLNIYYNLARINYDKENFLKSKNLYRKAIEIGLKNKLETSYLYNGLGSCSFLLGDTITAEYYYKLAIKSRIDYHGLDNKFIANEYLSYSIFLKRIGRKKEGLEYVNKSLALYRKYYGEKFSRTSQTYCWLGAFYLESGQPEKALECFQKALVSAVENFGNYGVEANPGLSGTYLGPELIEALKYKAQALDSIFAKNPADLDVLKNEFKTYELVLQAIHKQRTSFPELNSKLFVAGNEKDTYLGAIHAAYQLYKQTSDLFYKLKSFEFAEKSRSAILLTSLKEKQAMSYGTLPDSLVEKEKSYSQKIEKYQGMLLEERQKQGNNAEIIKEIENKIFQYRTDQNNLIARFEREFPQYYQLKYNDKVLDIPTIQKRLNPTNAILEYAVTERNILIFVITKDKYEVVPVSRTAVFDTALNQLNWYLREVSFISQEREDYEKFLSAGYTLYTKLIKPVEPIIRKKELIIVPDETLSSIPYEVLLTAKADPMQEFSTLPYLIATYPIGYAYSANLLFFNYKKLIPEKVRLAAFSPSYEASKKPGLQEPYLRPLKFAKEEAHIASEFFKGKVYDADEATESRFRMVAEKYDILHLAMHAVMDNENPMYSKLAFTRELGKENDGYLNTYELFNMKLRARMVVLSACNTGAGTMQKGEGIMSLARGFYYAGCPDVVMTLWPVEDKMSTQLIKDFYTFLSLGMNKIEALRLAKLNLIQSSDPLRSHPFFWAGYVNIGDISPVISIPKKKPTEWLWALTAGISLLLVAPMAWKKLKRGK